MRISSLVSWQSCLLAQSSLGHVILLWIVNVKVKVVIQPSQCLIITQQYQFPSLSCECMYSFWPAAWSHYDSKRDQPFFCDHLAWYPSVEDLHSLFHACWIHCDLAEALLAFYHMLLALQGSSYPAWYVSTSSYFKYGLVWIGLAVPLINFLIGDRVSELVPPIISSAESPMYFSEMFPGLWLGLLGRETSIFRYLGFLSQETVWFVNFLFCRNIKQCELDCSHLTQQSHPVPCCSIDCFWKRLCQRLTH